MSGKRAAEVKRCLADMTKGSLTVKGPSGAEIVESVRQAEMRWKNLSSRAEQLRSQLQQIPDRWKVYMQRYKQSKLTNYNQNNVYK